MLPKRKQFQNPRRNFFYATKICHKLYAPPFYNRKEFKAREGKFFMLQNSVTNCILQNDICIKKTLCFDID